MAERIFTDENFQKEVLESKMPVLVDAWAAWCQPCKVIGPLIEELARDYKGKMKIGKLNVDEYGATASKFGVMSIPTLLFFKDGELVDRLVGVQTKADLKKKIEDVMS